MPSGDVSIFVNDRIKKTLSNLKHGKTTILASQIRTF